MTATRAKTRAQGLAKGFVAPKRTITLLRSVATKLALDCSELRISLPCTTRCATFKVSRTWTSGWIAALVPSVLEASYNDTNTGE